MTFRVREVWKRSAGALFVSCGAVWLACAEVPTFSPGPGDGEDGGSGGADSAAMADTNDPGDAATTADSARRDASDASAPKYRLFVTKRDSILGNFGMTNAAVEADDICKVAANTANLSGDRWMALLWTTGLLAPSSRITQATGPFYQVTKGAGGPPGSIIVQTITSDAPRESPILDENGDAPEANFSVWTGGTATTNVDGLQCDNWKSNESIKTGTFGVLNGPNQDWMNAGEMSCSRTARIYCVEQPAL